MKKLTLILLLIPSPILSNDYHSSFQQNNKCYGNVYREKYIQGNIQNPGYVRKWEETITIPCDKHDIGINNKNVKINHYQKIFKDNLKKIIKWINNKIADWKLHQSNNYLNE